MPEQKNSSELKLKHLIWFIIAIIAVHYISSNLATVGKFLIVIIGFGLMVLIHELGHFTFAKLSKIKVEIFSIGMPPTALGIMRTEKGWRIRILPFLINKEKEETGEGGLLFFFGGKKKPGETEYQIGLIPFGGFVKMLGQEDFGEAKPSDDPKSYSNKPPHNRLAVIAGGVTFNIISAVIFFIIAFMVGIDSPPPIVGDVVPGYSAAKVGLVPGDEIVEIDGKSKDLDFSDIILSAVLSDPTEEIPVKVKHLDGSVEKKYLITEKKPGDSQAMFGIVPPTSLEIRKLTPEDANDLMEKTGLMPGDKIVSVNNQDIEHFWQLKNILSDYPDSVSLLAERKCENDRIKLIETKIPVSMSVGHVCSMVPRLKVESVALPKPSIVNMLSITFQKLLAKTGLVEAPIEYTLDLEKNDIIIGISDVNYPTYSQLRDVTESHYNKELPIKVLRKQPDGTKKTKEITAIPMVKNNKVILGIYSSPDVNNPAIAQTIKTKTEIGKLDIPAGSKINKINGVEVTNFIEITRAFLQNEKKKHIIEFTDTHGKKGFVSFEAENIKELIIAEPVLGFAIPFANLERTYKANGPAHAVAMGLRKTWRFINMSYASIKAMAQRRVGTDGAAGPIGILHMGYQIVSQRPIVYYVYFIGLISIAIAVFNFLPFPPLDGGLAVFLLIEKLKGSPVNPKFQLALASFGWILIGALAIYITINDVARIITGLF